MAKIKIDVSEKKKQYYLYALRLEHGRYYIGITSNIRKRLWQHYKGQGAKFTKAFKPLETLGVIDLGITYRTVATSEERRYTYKAIKKYGALCVRGGPYSWVNMPIEKLKQMQERSEAYGI